MLSQRQSTAPATHAQSVTAFSCKTQLSNRLHGVCGENGVDDNAWAGGRDNRGKSLCSLLSFVMPGNCNEDIMPGLLLQHDIPDDTNVSDDESVVVVHSSGMVGSTSVLHFIPAAVSALYVSNPLHGLTCSSASRLLQSSESMARGCMAPM